ncbi:hypothetical protein FB565_006781 [Actinoplanes lutulentus]|uniref:Uncharacterized protein n=1 Tax=Actinoplanes lutulentus TaxID=1287878 RepID=A0A327Z961_9ACTN|nr:hypothetical protein [Actinoplanes lutulentus]RAK30512.1 hypothetical protein B0I29_116171 [Actinoplanes lutulentus]
MVAGGRCPGGGGRCPRLAGGLRRNSRADLLKRLSECAHCGGDQLVRRRLRRPHGVTGTVLVRLSDQTGAWNGTFGTIADTAALNILITCDGDGFVTASYRVAPADEVAMKVSCGRPHWQPRDETGGPGPITVSIEPDGDQRWSLFVFRREPLPG